MLFRLVCSEVPDGRRSLVIALRSSVMDVIVERPAALDVHEAQMISRARA
jgi:hypothetical protein